MDTEKVQKIEGNIVSLIEREIFQGSVYFANGVITKIERHKTDSDKYILPGFIDAHLHIESSMLTPANFGKLAIAQGTVATVSDPHEIANVAGVQGIRFMIENSKKSPIKNFFTIPSCVPATPFDNAGDVITVEDIEALAKTGEFVALSEVMNVPGVLYRNEEVMRKIDIAHRYHLPIDGHAPTLRGDDMVKYAQNGITTDHECVSYEEARQKIGAGMKILIREGSAAKNYDALRLLIRECPEDIMFCTDDIHPDELIDRGHINYMVKRAVAEGNDVLDVLRIACLNPVKHYKLDIGLLEEGHKADFMVVDSLTDFVPSQVYIRGEKKWDVECPDHEVITEEVVLNNFCHEEIDESSLKKKIKNTTPVISLLKNEIITEICHYSAPSPTENLESNIENDILKIVYVNRYNNGIPQVAYCKGFGLKEGAIASSVAHDSHNIIAVGCSDKELCEAINTVIRYKGGLAVCGNNRTEILPLPIGGIMCDLSGEEVATKYTRLLSAARNIGCELDSPFMTLSFMSLVVIPEIKIGENGLFSYSAFNWID